MKKQKRARHDCGLKVKTTRCPSSFHCTSGQLFYGQLFSLLPDVGPPWDMRGAKKGTYLVDVLYAGGDAIAYVVWHESIDPLHILAAMNGEVFVVGEEEKNSTPLGCVELGRYWYDHLSQEDLEKIVHFKDEDDLYESSRGGFRSGFMVADMDLAGAICNFAGQKKAKNVGEKDVLLFRDDETLPEGISLDQHMAEDYLEGWVFTEQNNDGADDGLMCGFVYNFLYAKTFRLWSPDYDGELRLGDQILQTEDPDDEIYEEEEKEEESSEEDLDQLACVYVVMMRKLRRNNVLNHVPLDVVRIICTYIRAMDDIDESEINDLLNN